MDINTQSIQQYVRIALYWIFGALGSYGVAVPADNMKAVIVSVVGSIATFAWTLYGTRLNGLLEQIKAKSGVQEVQVKVDQSIIKPAEVNDNTSSGITAKVA